MSEFLPVDLAKKLPRHPIPIILLARLAVDISVQGQKLGETLLFDALQKILDLSQLCGIFAVCVDALDDSAATYYQRYQFRRFANQSLSLYLTMADVEAILL